MMTVFAAGGMVMWPLLFFSLLAIALIIERLVFWLRISRNQTPMLRRVLRSYRDDVPTAIALLKQNLSFPVARIFTEALALNSPTPSQFRLALESATQAELPKLRRFNTIFETIIALSPLLGLLGTVLGLIGSFASINLTEGSAGNAGAVTGGISEALVSTAAGLVVGIFVLLFANGFRGLYRRQLALIQEYGGQLEILYEMHHASSAQWETAQKNAQKNAQEMHYANS
ncbi:MAG: MotA/TolQ/ExbB proton channel family protein [Synechococcales cyanobacterium RM1_1_8]|nr:MotA/TolQ/ExbB proton channel family protein [Synechococcales cyanobacterium RM1_1_8]